jgi:hypothetical protein
MLARRSDGGGVDSEFDDDERRIKAVRVVAEGVLSGVVWYCITCSTRLMLQASQSCDSRGHETPRAGTERVRDDSGELKTRREIRHGDGEDRRVK